MNIFNFLTILLPIGSSLLGHQCVFFFAKRKLTRLEIISLSFPVGMLINSISGFFLNLFLFCSFVHFLVQTCISFAAALALYHLANKKIKPLRSKVSIQSYIIIGSWCVILIYLSSCAIFPTKDKIIKTGENDMLLEISMISSFTKGVNKKSNIFTGFQLNILMNITTYVEIIPVFYCSLMKSGGCSIRYSILTPTAFLFISISLLTFSYIYRITNNQLISTFSIPAVFFIGGFGFKNFVNKNDRSNGLTDYIFILGQNMISNWGHPMLHNFLTSRVNLTSLAISLSVFLLLECELVHFGAALTIVCLFVRPQSGFVLFLAFFMINYSNNKNKFDKTAIITKLKFYSIPFVGLSLLLLKRLKFSDPLWKSDISQKSFVPFLAFPAHIYGFGFFSLIFALRKKTVHYLATPIILFYFLSYFSLQNDHRFNFFSSQTVITPLIVSAISIGFSSLLKKCRQSDQIEGIMIGIVISLYVGMFLSSFAGVLNRIGQTFSVFGEDENEVSKWIIQNTKRKSVFAGPPTLNWNPAFTRAGRVGYVGNAQALQDFMFNTSFFQAELTRFLNFQKNKIEGVDYFLFNSEQNLDWKRILGSCKMLVTVFNNSKFTVMTWGSE